MTDEATTFDHQDLTGAEFSHVDLSRAVFRNVDLTGARLLGVDLVDVEIHGDVDNVVVNGVDIAPLVEAELDRRHPGRAAMRPTDVAGYRAAWDLLESLWADTVAKARTLPPEQLHASVDGEWSFIQTLRHLAFATDSWVNRMILGDPRPWHPLSLPWDDMTPDPAVPWDRDARPSLEEALALREDRFATVRRVLDDLTEEQLASETTPVEGPGWPPPRAFPVQQCLRIVLNEEWHHRMYAERDLDALLARA
ncbi:DinB family protein [Nocardioides sp. KIGAM211]|uniref:DinB family protein n=1 Tax=Nocardioides luti TaxID=2761101 RepID=A0A7X0V8T4_9ACTN|nr:DinB family protein [Nocardioides luti]MBB6625871.1 DinB family protein [Nocardioides luti]